MANNIFPPVETAYPIGDAHVDSLEAYQTQYAESMVSEMGYRSRL